MVPRPSVALDRTTITALENGGGSISKKWKISTFQQQDLVSNGLEDQRGILKAKGLTDIAISIILSNQ
ncbi:hypothetical protein AYI68_g1948 [Smittium mucronatum]|uniref:Uncharacterized protein n=1 Tax=Smittium mucronatum TaxID=133383 RepID=A0A1R0H4A5_9FUNG|nr:hypothetical protein AYI68_g1948 [Smittium mucronatum]